MGFSFVTEIPSPDVIRERFPLAPELAARKKERDEEIKKIITGESDKLLVVVGPCSADNEEAVVDYVSRLVKVQEKTKDRLVIVPRVYTNKPRTTGEGYMGMIHQPDPEKKPDMLEGILAIRHMHMRVLQETGFSTADEMLYPENLRYLSDIMSYIAVGARSVENQFRRRGADGLPVHPRLYCGYHFCRDSLQLYRVFCRLRQVLHRLSPQHHRYCAGARSGVLPGFPAVCRNPAAYGAGRTGGFAVIRHDLRGGLPLDEAPRHPVYCRLTFPQRSIRPCTFFLFFSIPT